MKIMSPSHGNRGYVKRLTYPIHKADVPRYGERPPKLNACGETLYLLSGNKFENSSTHDFAQHISA